VSTIAARLSTLAVALLTATTDVFVAGRSVGGILTWTVFDTAVHAQHDNPTAAKIAGESPIRPPPSAATNDRGSPIRISNVRMEHATDADGAPMTVVKFHTSNDGPAAIEHVVFAISIVARSASRRIGVRPRVLAGPFVIRARVGIKPGFTVDYEIGLRDVSVACGCNPDVRVISVRPHDE
jgi:hypothetical protein